MHRGAKRARALAMHHADLTDAARGAFCEVRGNQFAEVSRSEGVQIQFAGNGQRHRRFARVGRRGGTTHGVGGGLPAGGGGGLAGAGGMPEAGADGAEAMPGAAGGAVGDEGGGFTADVVALPAAGGVTGEASDGSLASGAGAA